jgi:AbiV family abortive infection protein
VAFAKAVDLLEEADILRSNERCARAYFLTHIACEELGKLPILTTTAVAQKLGHDVDWRRIDPRRLRASFYRNDHLPGLGRGHLRSRAT